MPGYSGSFTGNVAAGGNAPANAAYLTVGAVAGLSAEVNISSITATTLTFAGTIVDWICKFSNSDTTAGTGKGIVVIGGATGSTTHRIAEFRNAAGTAMSILYANGQWQGVNGSAAIPTYSFASEATAGMYHSGSALFLGDGGVGMLEINGGTAIYIAANGGAAGSPTYPLGLRCVTSGGARAPFFLIRADSATDTYRFSFETPGEVMIAAFDSRGWLLMDESDANPGTTNLDADDSVGIYLKAGRIAFAVNVAGAMKFLWTPVDGVTATWTADGTGP